MKRLLNLIQHAAIVIVLCRSEDAVVVFVMLAGMLAAFFDGMMD